jgi:hypothetical protein
MQVDGHALPWEGWMREPEFIAGLGGAAVILHWLLLQLLQHLNLPRP